MRETVMKKRHIFLLAVCVLAVLALTLGLTLRRGHPEENDANYGKLLTDLVTAYEHPEDYDARTINADVAAIRAVDRKDGGIAKSIADHWKRVYLDPDYTLCLWQGGREAPELQKSSIPNSARHAIVVLGYELKNGAMQPELEGRCEAAAAMARSFPKTILVCTGGATGENNPNKHTEAGLMKAYLTERCGIDPARIFIDEQAMTTQENAVNCFEILRTQKANTMTIVTSSYHQRWGQAVYNALAAVYRAQKGYRIDIVGDYSYDCKPDVPLYENDARIAVFQIAGILELPEEIGAPLFPPLAWMYSGGKKK